MISELKKKNWRTLKNTLPISNIDLKTCPKQPPTIKIYRSVNNPATPTINQNSDYKKKKKKTLHKNDLVLWKH